MPMYRWFNPAGGTTVMRQKLWLWLFARDYENVDTPINLAKAKVVMMERQIQVLKLEIEMAVSDRDATLKALEKAKLRDRRGNGITHWQGEKLRWYQFSIFQWAKPYVEPPPEYETLGPRMGFTRKRVKKGGDKHMNVSFLAHVKDRDTLRQQLEDGGVDDLTEIHRYVPGEKLKQEQGEKKQAFEQRKAANKEHID